MRMRLAVGALCALAFSFALTIDGNSVIDAVTTGPCDFLTGGGYIYPQGQVTGNKANFAIAGGCKQNAFWGHLQYQDKALYVKAHSTTVTGYEKVDVNTRLICGHGKSQDGLDFDWVVRVKDMGEPGNQDEFDIQMTGGITYTTAAGVPHKLGGGTRGGGNVQLHKPNPSTGGDFSTGTCPPFGGQGPFTLTVFIFTQAGGSGQVTSTSVPTGQTEINCTASPCSQSFAANSVVQLQAQGDAGSTAMFTYNVGADANTQCDVPPTSGTTSTCEVTMTEARSVTLTFIGQE